MMDEVISANCPYYLNIDRGKQTDFDAVVTPEGRWLLSVTSRVDSLGSDVQRNQQNIQKQSQTSSGIWFHQRREVGRNWRKKEKRENMGREPQLG